MTNLRGACLMRDFVEDVFLTHLIAWMLERADSGPVSIRTFAGKERPDLAVGVSNGSRERQLPAIV